MDTISKISVIVPLYNKESTIGKTIHSVLSQDYRDYELLIINDGSTDNSLKIVSEIKDERIRIHTKPNGGVSNARNCGIKLANGDYIFFLDADDIITSNCLSLLMTLAEKYPEAYVFLSNFISLSASGQEKKYCRETKQKLISNNFKAFWETKIFPRTGSMLIKRQCFEKIESFNPNISVFEDLELTLRLLGNFKVAYSPIPVLVYQREFNELSENRIAIEKEYSYYIDIQNKPFFEKLILADNVHLAFLNRLKLKDRMAQNHLISKNYKHIAYFAIAFFYKKALNLIYKFR